MKAVFQSLFLTFLLKDTTLKNLHYLLIVLSILINTLKKICVPVFLGFVLAIH